VNESRIDSFQQRVIKNCIKDVSDQLAQNYDNVRKGVEDIMVGPIADYEVIRIHDEGIEEGRKEGIKENETKYLLSLLKHVNAGMISIDGAASIANMSVEEFKKASADLNS
jgi:predicted HTH domain antitoxin